MGRDSGHLAGAGVAADHDLAAAPRRTHHLFGRDDAARTLDLLAILQAAEVRTRLNAQPLRRVGIEASRPLVFDQRVPERAHAVRDRERADLEALVANGVTLGELDQFDVVAELAKDAPEHREQVAETLRPDDAQRALAVLKVIGLQQPREPEVMVGWVGSEVDLVELHQAGRALHLPLRPLTAVEQDALTADAHEQAGGGPPRRRDGAAGAQEDDR